MADPSFEHWATLVSVEGETLPIRATYRPPDRPGPESVGTLPRIAFRSDDAAADLRVKTTLGEGGMGIVHLAEQVAIGRDVAVKTLRKDRAGEDLVRTSLLQEARITGVLEHPNIVPVYTLGQDIDGAPVIVMKRIEGREWAELLRLPADDPAFDGRSPLVFHLNVLIQVCQALKFAHSRDIIHRDLKPENVMIGSFGEVYLLDWGIALSVGDSSDNRFPRAADVTAPAGTPAYMAPEMTTGDGPSLGVHTDVYLAGAVLHEVLTGNPPHVRPDLMSTLMHAFRSEPPEYSDEVPRELASIATRAMAAEPRARWHSVDEMRELLLGYLDHRAAYALVDEADLRRAQLDEAIVASDDAAVRELIAAARFAYKQALREWPALEAAEHGLRSLLLTMLEWELKRENLDGARAVAAELDSLPEKWSEEIAALESTMKQREEEFRRLKELEAEHDLEIGRNARYLVALFFAAVWGWSPLIVHEMLSRGMINFEPAYFVAHSGFIVAFGMSLIFFFRKLFFRNQANRRIVFGVATMMAAIVDYRIFVWVTGLELPEALVPEFFIYGLGVAMVAITTDLILLVGAFVYFVGALLAGFYPENVLPILAICNCIVPSTIGLYWRPKEAA